MPFVQPTATRVTIFAGVNEINVDHGRARRRRGGSDPNGFMDAQVRAFGADYATLADRHQGPRRPPRIVALNVPNVGRPAVPRRRVRWRSGRPRSARRRHDQDRRQSLLARTSSWST